MGRSEAWFCAIDISGLLPDGHLQLLIEVCTRYLFISAVPIDCIIQGLKQRAELHEGNSIFHNRGCLKFDFLVIEVDSDIPLNLCRSGLRRAGEQEQKSECQ